MSIYKYNHQGQRLNQEDSIGNADKVFIVCDGIGGHEKGEVASTFVVNKILEKANVSGFTDEEDIRTTLSIIQTELNEKLKEMPEAKGMGTTFCGLFITKDAYYVAHVGDSRLYWVRPQEQKICHTWDHSIVAELVKRKEITREEARLHPMGNRISQAIIANVEGKIATPEITMLKNVKAEDLFLICTDGVTESWNEYELIKVLCDTKISSSDKFNTIKEKCIAESRDNNSAYLLEIDELDEVNSGADKIEWLNVIDFEKDFNRFQKKNAISIVQEEYARIENRGNKVKLHLRKIKNIVVITLTLLLLFFIYKKFFSTSTGSPNNGKDTLKQQFGTTTNIPQNPFLGHGKRMPLAVKIIKP